MLIVLFSFEMRVALVECWKIQRYPSFFQDWPAQATSNFFLISNYWQSEIELKIFHQAFA